MTNLRSFRDQLSTLLQTPNERPFVCTGSPLTCSVFLVGFNPATRLEIPFWSFWDNGLGFNRERFIQVYESARSVEGVRKRLNEMVPCFPPGSVLETNICSEPTKKAADLKPQDRRTEIFLFLLKSIRPKVVFLHSNEPIKFFRTLLDDPAVALPHHQLVKTSALGSPITVCASEGPLWRKKVSDAVAVAKTLAAGLSR